MACGICRVLCCRGQEHYSGPGCLPLLTHHQTCKARPTVPSFGPWPLTSLNPACLYAGILRTVSQARSGQLLTTSRTPDHTGLASLVSPCRRVEEGASLFLSSQLWVCLNPVMEEKWQSQGWEQHVEEWAGATDLCWQRSLREWVVLKGKGGSIFSLSELLRKGRSRGKKLPVPGSVSQGSMWMAWIRPSNGKACAGAVGSLRAISGRNAAHPQGREPGVGGL